MQKLKKLYFWIPWADRSAIKHAKQMDAHAMSPFLKIGEIFDSCQLEGAIDVDRNWIPLIDEVGE